MVIINADCGKGGHFCHSYWDFMCPPVSGSFVPYCSGQSITITGPPSTPGAPAFTYQWYKHRGTRSIIPGATSQTLTTTPAVGDTFSVYVNPQAPLNCGFFMPFVPKDTCFNPNGVNEIFNSAASIFPNPSSGNIFLDFGNKNFGKAKVSFSDVIGSVLLETTISASGKQMLDVSGFSNGIYFVRINADAGSVTKKIIIHH